MNFQSPERNPRLLLKQATRRLTKAVISLSLLLAMPALLASPVQAEPPSPFHTSYDAYYGDFKAVATRTLGRDATSGRFVLNSKLELAILGSIVTSISERSEFLWKSGQPLPLVYEYAQEGFGARKRSIRFDHEEGKAEFTINSTTGALDLQGPAFDELSGYLLLEEQLRAGATDISFDVVDRDELKNVHYKVQGREVLSTSLGAISAIRLERIRDEDSSRRTEIWLAPGHHYMMVKLLQEEPNGRVIRLEIREASYDGKPVVAGQVVAVP